MTNTAIEDNIYDASGHQSQAALLSLNVSVVVAVGRARATIEQLLAAGSNAVIALDTKIDDLVELMIGDQVIGRGRLVDFPGDGGIGVEIVEVLGGPS